MFVSNVDRKQVPLFTMTHETDKTAPSPRACPLAAQGSLPACQSSYPLQRLPDTAPFTMVVKMSDDVQGQIARSLDGGVDFDIIHNVPMYSIELTGSLTDGSILPPPLSSIQHLRRTVDSDQQDG